MPSGEQEPEDPRGRQALLTEIARLSAGVRRLGLNLGSMRGVARAMDMFAAKRGNEVSAEDLEAAKRELVAALRGLRRRETTHAERVSNLRFAAGAAALAALFGGAIVQRAWDPIGRAQAYFARPSDSEATSPEEPDVSSEETPESEKPQSFSPPPFYPQPPTLPPSLTPPTSAAKPQPRESADTPAPFIVDLTDSNFRHYISRGTWVVDFYADWCGPCQAMRPVFDGLFRAHKDRRSNVNFGKLQVNDYYGGQHAPVADDCDVRGLPTFIFFRNGREIGRLEGAGHTADDFDRILGVDI